jgi:hypothetical protein
MSKDMINAVVSRLSEDRTTVKQIKLPEIPPTTIRVSVETVTRDEFQLSQEK